MEHTWLSVVNPSMLSICSCYPWPPIIGCSGGSRGGSMGSTPLLKSCLQKYYAQTYRVHYTHTDATHFGFNSSNNACVSTPVSRIQRAHSLHAHQRLVATIETMSELRLIHTLLPLHLGIVICYQYESAYFPASYAITSCFAASAA